MFRISRLGRLAAAAVLVASGATVALTSTATAANTAINFDCLAQYTNLTVNNSDTITITITSGSCGFIALNNPPGGALGTATLNGFPLTAGNPIAASNGAVVVYTAPASGSGNDGFAFFPNLQSPPGSQIGIAFPSPSGSIVDNGDGTATATYSGNVLIYLLTAGSTCADPIVGGSDYEYMLTGENPPQAALAASPALIDAGTMAMTSSGPTAIAAGTYQACMYAGTGQGAALLLGLEVNLGQVAPTTTSTTSAPGSSTTTSPAGDPVVPAFAG